MLKHSIELMFERDREIRRRLSESSGSKDEIKAAMHRVDRENTGNLKRIVTRFGWRHIMESAGESLWLIVQHADHDVRFQKRAYNAFRRYGKEAIPSWQIAFLYDRILINCAKPQKYGTQLIKSHETKKWQPAPLQNAEKVNEYRVSVGLGTIEEYVDKFNQTRPIK